MGKIGFVYKESTDYKEIKKIETWDSEEGRAFKEDLRLGVIDDQNYDILTLKDEVVGQLKGKDEIFDFVTLTGDGSKIAENLDRALMNVRIKPIINYVIRHPKAGMRLPISLFETRETLPEEILTAYEELKVEELKNLSNVADAKNFVRDVRKDVSTLSSVFVNVKTVVLARKDPSILLKQGSKKDVDALSSVFENMSMLLKNNERKREK